MRQLAVKDHERAVPTEQARFMMVPGRTVVSGATVEALGVRRTESCPNRASKVHDGANCGLLRQLGSGGRELPLSE